MFLNRIPLVIALCKENFQVNVFQNALFYIRDLKAQKKELFQAPLIPDILDTPDTLDILDIPDTLKQKISAKCRYRT